MESQKFKFSCIDLDSYKLLKEYCNNAGYDITHNPVRGNKNYLDSIITIRANNLPDLFPMIKSFKLFCLSNPYLRNCMHTL